MSRRENRYSRQWVVFGVFSVLVAVQALLYLATRNFQFPPTFEHADAPHYLALAANLHNHHVFSASTGSTIEPSMSLPVGYPLFVAAFMELGFDVSIWVPIVQLIMLSLIAWIVFNISRHWFDIRVAWVSGILTVTYSQLLTYAFLGYTEILCTLCLVIGMYMMSRTLVIKQGSWTSFAVGLSFGVVTLVRSNFAILIAIPVLIGFFSPVRWHWRQRVRHLVLICFGFWLIVGPWCIRNTVLAGRPMTLGTGGGIVLYASVLQYADTPMVRVQVVDWVQWLAYQKAVIAKATDQVDTIEKTTPLGMPKSIAIELATDKLYKDNAVELFRTIPVTTFFKTAIKRLFWMWYVIWGYGLDNRNFFHWMQFRWIFSVELLLAGIYRMRNHIFSYWIFWAPALYLTCFHMVFSFDERYLLPARVLLGVICAAEFIVLWDEWRILRPNLFRFKH